MMEILLKEDFIAHYALGKCIVHSVSTNNKDFDLKDDTEMVYPSGEGIAKYHNANQKEIKIINYESYINSLSEGFKRGREKCDLLIYASDYSHFILNELTDTDPKYISDFTSANGEQKLGKRNKAIAQLKQSLIDLSNVASIQTFLNKHIIRKCCFFNKQINPPHGITAIAAFNRLSTLSNNGYQLSNSVIESYNFELWEFSGNQICELSIIKESV